MTNRPFKAHRAVSITLLVSAIAAANCATAAPTASGKAFDMNVSVSILGTPILTVTPQTHVEFSNLATAFQNSAAAPSFTAGDPTTVALTTGELSTATQWIPGATFLAVGTNATLADFSLIAVNPNTAIDPHPILLTVGATQIQATSIVTGSCPPAAAKSLRKAEANTDIVGDFVFESEFETQTLTTTNTTDIPGLQVAIDGTGILGIPANPLPNTSIDIGSVGTFLLNKQTISGDGLTGLSSVVDAVLLNIDLNVSTVSLLQANVNISHSEASIACN